MALVKKVLIVGGGIGGMCAAIQLRKQGIDVDLAELNPDWAVYGAGITLSGATLRALRTIGVADEVIHRGGSWSEIDFYEADGKHLQTVSLESAVGGEGLPASGGIMRPVLAEILSRATRAAGVNVWLGRTFRSITQDSHGVQVVFDDESSGGYDLVIGADGVNSKVRQAVFPGAATPRFTGQGSWRAVVTRTSRNSMMFMGKSTKAGLNPVSETQSYLFVLDQRDRPDFVAEDQWPQMLADLLSGFGGPIGDICQRLREGLLGSEQIVYRPLVGLLMGGPWHSGRVALLGDAVHATTPHLASGAGLAVEGAIVLAQELQRRHSVEGALMAYAGRHYDRARLVVKNSLRLGEIEQAGGSKGEHLQLMSASLTALREAI